MFVKGVGSNKVGEEFSGRNLKHGGGNERCGLVEYARHAQEADLHGIRRKPLKSRTGIMRKGAEKQLGHDAEAKHRLGCKVQLRNSEMGFPCLEYDFNPPAQTVDRLEILEAPHVRADIGDEDRPSHQKQGFFRGRVPLVLFGYGLGFPPALVGYRVGNAGAYEPRCNPVFLAKQYIDVQLPMLAEFLAQIDGFAGFGVDEGGPPMPSRKEKDPPLVHELEVPCHKIAQIAQDQIACASHRENIAGRGLVIAGEARDG